MNVYKQHLGNVIAIHNFWNEAILLDIRDSSFSYFSSDKNIKSLCKSMNIRFDFENKKPYSLLGSTDAKSRQTIKPWFS